MFIWVGKWNLELQKIILYFTYYQDDNQRKGSVSVKYYYDLDPGDNKILDPSQCVYDGPDPDPTKNLDPDPEPCSK
jgi:hypothetical protein